jgi:phytoene dehydrogenase-like protein
MDCEVAVVGGGIGGLTVAALLAQRGVDVCLIEREPRAGGCAASFEKFGYCFEPGYGLFTGWGPDEIHQRVFSELPVTPPEVRLWESAYCVRLPDSGDIFIAGQNDQFEAELRRSFPECLEKAVEFYQKVTRLSDALRRSFQRTPGLLSAPWPRRGPALFREGRIAAELLRAANESTAEHLEGVSLPFRRFIDAQLQSFTQGSSSTVSFLWAALALSMPQRGVFAMRGGAAALANSLADSIKLSGGRIRLDTSVLRLAYDSTGHATGVDLLTGENLKTSKAMVSNLTVWDTYGKLVGLNRTPFEIRKQLKALRGWGAYLLYLGLDETLAIALASNHVLAVTDLQENKEFDPEHNQLMFSATPSWDVRAPTGKRAVTVHAFTNVDDWFTFHNDETELEDRDQQMLERCWTRLHSAMPELGSGIEVIDTATPQTFYEATRRKLGMVGGVVPSAPVFWQPESSYKTSLSNLFIVSDTTHPGGIEGLTRSAFLLADHLTR